jgi:SAM-dependent methyltransferase
MSAIGTTATDRETLFIDLMWAGHASPRILELGTRRWEPDRPTHHRAWAPHGTWVFGDMQDGEDVDVVTDAHTLNGLGAEPFDGYVAFSVYEHLQRPWLAAEAAHRVLKPGGWAYVGTHQTFPIHGYPNDYWRFTASALELIFRDAGFVVRDVGYAYPCTIVPPHQVTRWNPAAQAFLNVDILVQKP